MRIADFIRSKGLVSSHVANKAGISRQALDKLGSKEYGYTPTAKSLEKVAKAMTEYGVPTTVVDLVAALYKEE